MTSTADAKIVPSPTGKEAIITQVSENRSKLNLQVAKEKLRAASKAQVGCWSCFGGWSCFGWSCFGGAKKVRPKDFQMSLRHDRKPTFSREKYLLGNLSRLDRGKKTLVLDLDETLVHSSFIPINDPDFVVPVIIDNHSHNVYVLKRPGVDEFLSELGQLYEIVVFTASLAKYADPVLDAMDTHKIVKHRLFRESCVKHKEGNFVKDLSLLGRDLKSVVIIDNSPSCYMFHPSNAIAVTSWFNDPNDKELIELIPFLKDLITVDNVTLILNKN